MTDKLTFFLKSFAIILPLFIILVKIIFKKSAIVKIGYILVITIFLTSIITSVINLYNLPQVIALPIRITIVISALLFLKKETKILKEMSDIIKSLSELDLSVSIDNKHLVRKDEYGLLANSLKKMTNELNIIIQKIQKNANHLSYSSSQLALASEQISEGATEQASTSEEISSSVEELIATIESNAEKSNETNNITSSSAQKIDVTFEIFKKTIASINSIADKVKIIAKISQKTNMLALNATIEAVKAGSEGRGFAVVAKEVKSLAENSKNALTTIKEISDSSLEVSHIADEKFQEIIPDILKSAELVSSITIASREQLSGAELINSAVQQLAQVTNQNSVSAEEMSASSEELAAQANELKEIISVFVLNK